MHFKTTYFIHHSSIFQSFHSLSSYTPNSDYSHSNKHPMSIMYYNFPYVNLADNVKTPPIKTIIRISSNKVIWRGR